MKPFALLAVLFATAPIMPAFAADICEAIVLRDVPAVEEPSSILRRGEHDTAITQYRVNKKTGMGSFCSHGGYCYPTDVLVDGQKVEALRLTNCKVGKKDDFDDPDDVFYRVDVLRSKVSPRELRVDDVDNRLLEMGLCSACAGNAAHYYVEMPNSKCGRLVKATLEGNPAALRTLKDGPGYCN
ncbi:hypothetical protein K9U39_18015 [Rhodoblastus acidophilus]|uniref:Uncharacterized protein n=1 Tax=Candidatus Rhodoblastus alkanivorans TaxID=2954117 RepID=A0ABS9Z263_9HYPH|nr:hypothetical protein [Candidatus Rhodoblastus alkanivorans]MCI4680595.1 hypothetical protein [Candidatus Rhodoblastus alkanivorans]MCI4681759.1 hypothetical protein [Candidatus Rhodoblastus alkanivorans]MDI4642808.1 hypothetical protein [Rhodoblastus acidophilus]